MDFEKKNLQWYCRESRQVQILLFQITAALSEYAFILFVMRNGRMPSIFGGGKAIRHTRARWVMFEIGPLLKCVLIPPVFCSFPHYLIMKVLSLVTLKGHLIRSKSPSRVQSKFIVHYEVCHVCFGNNNSNSCFRKKHANPRRKILDGTTVLDILWRIRFWR